MCAGCWAEAGSPKIDNEKTRAAAAAIDRVYEFSGAGGNLHIVVDDWNLEDSSLEWCKVNAIVSEQDDEKREAEMACYTALRELTEEERYSAMAIRGNLI